MYEQHHSGINILKIENVPMLHVGDIAWSLDDKHQLKYGFQLGWAHANCHVSAVGVSYLRKGFWRLKVQSKRVISPNTLF